MRRSRVLAKIRAGKVARICSLGHFLPYYPRLAAGSGYDGIWVDGEHRAFDARETQALAAFHHLADIDCVWRAPTLGKTGLYRLLEDGVTGLMIPHVSTAEKARDIVEAAKFPPVGDRGLDGVGLDAGFWPGGTGDYSREANRETFVVVQIETPQALENLEAIAAVPGIDVLFLGPGDLSFRLGCGAGVHDPRMMEVQGRLATLARQHGKAWGRPVDGPEEVKRLEQMGAQFLALGNEFLAVYSGLRAWGAEFDAALGEGSSGKDASVPGSG
jgi:4-hydroxy-2-oxoheptanedioate aldolase